MKQIRTIISTGQGRLHLIQSAVALKEKGVIVRVVTGWIPSRLFSDKVINFLGSFVGRKGNLAHGLKKRTPPGLNHSELKSCGFSEFFIQGLFILSNHKFWSNYKSAIWGWKIFGVQSRIYINNADIFHVRSGAGQGGAIKKARRRGMKVIVDHSIAHPNEMALQLLKAAKRDNIHFNKYAGTSPDDGFWKLVLDDCLNADILLVNSEYVKWSFAQNGYPQDKIRVVELGVNEEFRAVKQDYKSTDNRIRLVFTGSFGSRKGASLIINALTELQDKGVNFQFDVVGNVASELCLPSWMNESENIRFHGHLRQDQMAEILLKSDIYVFPSYTEGSAQTVKEAMAVGLPVVTTRQSGSPVVHKENGWLIEDDNAAALLEAIIDLSGNELLRKRLGEAGANTIRNEHTWSRYADKVIEVYQDVLQAH